MKTSSIGLVAAAYMMVSGQNAVAGEFSVSCYFKNSNIAKCASVISDLVTDKFIARFPASKFQIFVFSDVHRYTNGGFAAYAVAGVIPRGSNQFPLQHFSSSLVNRGDKKFDALELSKFELEVYRSATKGLMDECEISPNCDVFRAAER